MKTTIRGKPYNVLGDINEDLIIATKSKILFQIGKSFKEFDINQSSNNIQTPISEQGVNELAHTMDELYFRAQVLKNELEQVVTRVNEINNENI